ncbi:MAG: SpvB/TcaC N-terminal domain-containing protein [Ferruginibacter sp.]
MDTPTFSVSKHPSFSAGEQSTATKSNAIEVPSIALPKGGGAIKSIDEKFSVNAVNGTAGFSIPFPFSPSRNAFMPSLSLSYNSGTGNGIFGLGWNAEPASITRKTDKKLPEYNDAEESDTFLFSGAEDLVPVLGQDPTSNSKRYIPRIEGGFARIEKMNENGNVYWKVTSKDNIVSIFGKTAPARIADPANPAKIFKWLLEFSCDDKGNCFRLEYEKEDETLNIPDKLYERNRRNGIAKYTNAYLKRVKYCNKAHFDRNTLNTSGWENVIYLLELVLDYKRIKSHNPQLGDTGWTCRADPFSDYRSGFDIRTYRLCRRILMFHHFNELGVMPCLVRSMDFKYHSGTAFTFLRSITQTGYIKYGGIDSKKSLPPIEFKYEKLDWQTEVKSLPKKSLENLPVGIDDQSYQWIDLHGDGLSGILTEQANGWYYKSNSGNGNFDSVKLVSPKPAMNGLSNGTVHFQDLEANGQKFLVSNDLNGFYEYTPEEEWLPFKPFNEVANINLHDANTKMLDLNGDGKADILISEDDMFVWYPSKGKQGFESYRTARKNSDEEKGPNIVFADSTQSIVLADMSGDGLMDIVRIRCNDIVYWPNLGYGKFGAKVSMSNAPAFDHPDHFNPKYIKLADIDGSGTTDIIYLADNSFKIYFNQSGNSWSDVNIVPGVNPLPFPAIDDHTNVNIIDLLGNGTGCIVWSSPLPPYAQNPLRYIDLMGGKKPHVMTSYKNNMGKEVTMQYKPSTYFYLEDKKAGHPWITKLPFPVQCVEMVVTVDKITKTRFTNHYRYHHGYYDYKEREFRGFGRVDQTDTEHFEDYKKNIINGSPQLHDKSFFEPPILTKTWFHTGAFLGKEKILKQFEHEYYQNALEKKLQEPLLDDNLTTDEIREALRACKGMPLHVEVYSKDGSDKEDIPYTTAHHTCKIKLLQAKANNAHAVFLVHESEALTYTYERHLDDPRVAHVMNIEIDDYGNVLKSAAIGYGRKIKDPDLTATEQAAQEKINIIYTENGFTTTDNPDIKLIDTPVDYRLPVLFKTKTYELTGYETKTDPYFSVDEIVKNFPLTNTDYEKKPAAGKQKRLIEHIKIQFLKNDLSGPLDFGKMQSLLLPYQSFQLALTPGLVTNIFGTKVNDSLLTGEGKYVKLDDNYWIASGTQTFDATHFYQVIKITDPFSNHTLMTYDTDYHFYILQTEDALQNISAVVKFNFRTLSPYLVKDINDNRTGVRTDALGMVISSFVMGKATEAVGDEMEIDSPDLSANDHSTNLLEYDLNNYQQHGKPNFVKTTISDIYYRDQKTPNSEQTYESYAYSDGSGNVLMTKVQAEPGKAKEITINADKTVTVNIVDTSSFSTKQLRWIGNGRTILNNKGKPVKQYEPYFSINPYYEDAKELVEQGVTPIITYDAAGRVIRTDMPDGTFTKVEFDAWKQISYDAVDTVLKSQWYIDRGSPAKDKAIPVDPEQRAAWLSAILANTPSISYLDSLGRPFLAVQHNRTFNVDEVSKKATDITNEIIKTFTETDIEGNLRSVTDARENVVMQYKYDMLGHQLYSLSMDAGERWMLNDATGKPIHSWDMKYHYSTIYDVLHRPLQNQVEGTHDGATLNHTIAKIDYGETAPNALENNLKGKPYQVYDSSGLMVTEQADFKGKILIAKRQLAKIDPTHDEKAIDWTYGLNTPQLEKEVFTKITEYDAMNRMRQLQNWHIPQTTAGIYTPQYNDRGVLFAETVQIGTGTIQSIITETAYDAKGQKQYIKYGNGTTTRYFYDPFNFRLRQLRTTRIKFDPSFPNKVTDLKDSNVIQNLFYTYDPVGNITGIYDDAYEPAFLNNQKVEPKNEYSYDAIYRLIEATGRENSSFNNTPGRQGEQPEDISSFPITATVLRNYIQTYEYDKVGNIKTMSHRAGNGALADRWTRHYEYETTNNRLKNTFIGTDTINAINYNYDAHGSILNLEKTIADYNLVWNYDDMLHNVNLGGGGHAFYLYDAGKQRSRKQIFNKSGQLTEDRVYLEGFELYRHYGSGADPDEIIGTHHVFADSQRIAIIENVIKTNNTLLPVDILYRYQYSNHLGSAGLELNETGAVISYEEYHPYGTSAFNAKGAGINATAKRYRYTGMERDEESGLAYHTARYYLPWLGRWLSADPIGIGDGVNVYQYCSDSPVIHIDLSGKNSLEDLFKLIYNESGFRAADTSRGGPPRFVTPHPRGTGGFGMAAHAEPDLGLLSEMQSVGENGEGFVSADRIFSEVAIDKTTGIVRKIGGSPIRGAHNIDLVGMPQGVANPAVGQAFPPGHAEAVGDMKYGKGEIPAGQAQFGQRALTVKGSSPSSPGVSLGAASETELMFTTLNQELAPVVTPRGNATLPRPEPNVKTSPEVSGTSVALSFAGQFLFVELWGYGREKTLSRVVEIQNKNYSEISTEERDFMIDVGYEPNETIFNSKGVIWDETIGRKLTDALWKFMNTVEIVKKHQSQEQNRLVY